MKHWLCHNFNSALLNLWVHFLKSVVVFCDFNDLWNFLANIAFWTHGRPQTSPRPTSELFLFEKRVGLTCLLFLDIRVDRGRFLGLIHLYRTSGKCFWFVAKLAGFGIRRRWLRGLAGICLKNCGLSTVRRHVEAQRSLSTKNWTPELHGELCGRPWVQNAIFAKMFHKSLKSQNIND